MAGFLGELAFYLLWNVVVGWTGHAALWVETRGRWRPHEGGEGWAFAVGLAVWLAVGITLALLWR